ncbi:MAG: hypothetical protein KC493_09365 [Bacteriovoracaceae bacterium]|nr:hypothetical protein [Bacteriovoracaceae bacterium]
MANDLSKQDLYESVKALVEAENHPHILLPQQKLFTLFSLAFQYLLFMSTKQPGAYVIRVEDSQLAEKLVRKSKDPSTRKFMQTLSLPRKLKYGKSVFFLDFFHAGSWNLTSEIPKEKFKAALIVKNTSSKPMDDIGFTEPETEDVTENEDGILKEEETVEKLAALPKDYYYTSLKEASPKTVMIWFDGELEGTHSINFPFIKKEKERALSGVTISKGVDLENIES